MYIHGTSKIPIVWDEENSINAINVFMAVKPFATTITYHGKTIIINYCIVITVSPDHSCIHSLSRVLALNSCIQIPALHWVSMEQGQQEPHFFSVSLLPVVTHATNKYTHWKQSTIFVLSKGWGWGAKRT